VRSAGSGPISRSTFDPAAVGGDEPVSQRLREQEVALAMRQTAARRSDEIALIMTPA
jgi:hypothetical protein